jgi:hypothetical protein
VVYSVESNARSGAMERIPEDELERIIERDAPGYTLARPREGEDERVVRAEPEETSPDIETLRKKYLGDAESADAADDAGESANLDSEDAESPTENTAEDEIVAVRPKKPGDPYDQPARPKTVVVSGKDRRIVGRQG